MQHTDAHPPPEHPHRHRRLVRRHIQIHQRRRTPPTLQMLEQLQHRPLLRNDRLPPVLRPQRPEQFRQRRILEILRNDHARARPQRPPQRQPLEITKVRRRKHTLSLQTRPLRLRRVPLKLKPPVKSLLRQPRTPEKFRKRHRKPPVTPPQQSPSLPLPHRLPIHHLQIHPPSRPPATIHQPRQGPQHRRTRPHHP